MAERKYQGAGIGIDRMNRILNLLLHGEKTITQITIDLCICDRAAKNYTRKLLELGKITMRRGDPDKRFKFYSLVPGAMPLPAVQPIHGPRKARRTPGAKTGPKPSPEKKTVLRPVKSAEKRTVKVAAAQQIGIQRDPFTAALFGTTQRQGA